MELVIYIVIGIVVAVVIYLLVTKSSVSREHEINNEKNKKTQFNPEKVTGLMPNKKKSEVEKDNQ
jgi:predicted RND superfamily exporter protein